MNKSKTNGHFLSQNSLLTSTILSFTESKSTFVFGYMQEIIKSVHNFDFYYFNFIVSILQDFEVIFQLWRNKFKSKFWILIVKIFVVYAYRENESSCNQLLNLLNWIIKKHLLFCYICHGQQRTLSRILQLSLSLFPKLLSFEARSPKLFCFMFWLYDLKYSKLCSF